MSEASITLSVVIPSYNEMKNLKKGLLDQVHDFLSKQSYSWELILTDDGSTDGTVDQLKAFAERKSHVKVLQNRHSGKGPTVSAGMLTAEGKYRAFTDFDQSTPIEEVNRAMDLIKKGYDVVIGSREGEGAKRDEEPFYRHLMGRVFNFFVQLLALRGIQDSQCGFKMFSDSATKKLFTALFVYGETQERKDAFMGAFDVEILFLARKWGLKLKEMPVEWRHVESDRVNPLKDSVRMFRDILRIRFAWAAGKYTLKTSE
ncbi:MAG: dolichyl-phosphate beta-glucosyltransferase [Patescibacteria group bacterium]